MPPHQFLAHASIPCTGRQFSNNTVYYGHAREGPLFKMANNPHFFRAAKKIDKYLDLAKEQKEYCRI